MADYVLHLGDITIDIPPEEKIEFKAAQALAKIDRPGKRPTYQDMGPDEEVCSWSGIIEDSEKEEALKKADALKTMKDKGESVKLLYADISKTVIIRRFDYTYYSTTRVRYEIELVLVEEEDTAAAASSTSGNQVSDKITEELPLIGGLFPDLKKFEAVKTHTVKQNDNLRSIAAELCGDPHSWQPIAWLNNMTGSEIPPEITELIVPLAGDGFTKIQSKMEEALNKIPPLPVKKEKKNDNDTPVLV